MKVTILTYGSRGDVQPCLALAVALRRAGHTPRLALPETLRLLADELEIPVTPLPGDIARLSGAFNRPGQGPFGTMQVMLKHIAPVALEVGRAAWQACQDADVIIHTFLFTAGAHTFARQLGVPDVSVQFFPVFITSPEFPYLTFPELPLGPLYNRLTHWIGNAAFEWVGRAGYAGLRKAAPEFPPRLEWPFRGRAPSPLLFAFSPALIPVRPAWGAHVQATGFWFLDAPAYAPPPELVEFLTAGLPPVFVSFGSMIHPNAARLQPALLEGLRQAGQRAIILTGWDGWAAVEPGPDRLFLQSAPHDWLFPRCAAILHHGGAGTTAAALRSGQPSLVLPLAVDQPFWARRVYAAGASPAPLNPRTLDAARVKAAVTEALENDTIRQRAAALGAAIRREPGVNRAIEIIESVYFRSGNFV